MNLLYLHGLDSKLSPEKKAILEKFGTVHAPDLNYYTNPNAIETILKAVKGEQIDVVMGSSMGGFAAYHVANALEKPAMMFNPALVERSVTQHIPPTENVNRLQHIVLGQVDEVVSPFDTLDFLKGQFNPVTHVHIHLVPGLGHNIPVEFFEKEVGAFMARLE